jgi:hypothetical protein
MARQDGAKGAESAAVVTPADPRNGTRIADAEDGREPKMPDAPKGTTGHWEPVQVADDPAGHYRHAQVWVEHHGIGNGRWMDGELHKWVEDEA